MRKFHYRYSILLLSGLFLFSCKGKPQSGATGNPSLTAIASAQAAEAPAPKQDLSGMRVYYDLVTNRVHGIAYRQGRLLMDAGSVDFYKFVDGGWKGSWLLSQKDENRPAALISGVSASLSFPLDGEGDGPPAKPTGDQQLSIAMRSLAPGQKVSVFMNEKPLATLDVGKDPATYDVTVPAATLTPGENRVRLTFKSAAQLPGGKRSAAAIFALEFGEPRAAAAPQAPSAHPLAGKMIALGGVSKRGFRTEGPSRLSFYVQVPAKGRLALAMAGTAPGAKGLVRVTRDGTASVTLWEGALPGQLVENTWDLGGMAGQAVRLDFVSRGGGAVWAEPRIVVPGQVPAKASEVKFDHIYVWMIDTFRADKMRAYNPKSIVETPNYDAFAADATRFAWNQVPGTWSLPSQASMLTGVYPNVHKATEHESKILPTVPFVAELLKKAGFRTGLFSSNGYVSSKWGFGRGFDENRNLIRESLPNGADTLWGLAKKWILSAKERSQFVYLAVIEPHVIYNPKKEFLLKYWNKPYNGPIKPVLTGIQLGKIKQGTLKVNDTDKAYLEALHNAEVTQSDTAFGVFLADLRAAGLYDRSAIIVISDHGDEFWDHGDVGHAQAPHQELVHVPLIVRAPGLLATGKVIEADVEAMDLTPTLLALAGQPIPEAVQGRSLLTVAQDELSCSPSTGLTQTGGITRGFKSGRYRFNHSGVAKMNLFDEIEDPREQSEIAAKRPIALRQMRTIFSLLVGFENQWKKSSWGSAANLNEAFYAAVAR